MTPHTTEQRQPKEVWNENIPSTVSTLIETINESTHSTNFSRQQLTEELQSLVDRAVEINKNEWDKTSNCPNCGYDNLTHYVEEMNMVVCYLDGNSKVKGTHRDKDTLAYDCFECGEVLRMSPKGLLLEKFAEQLDGFEVLHDVLELVSQINQPNGEWERGQECPNENCTRTDINEFTVYAESASPQENTIYHRGTGEVVETTRIQCDSCSEPILETPTDQLSSFTL